ncbi:nuclear transcription factor Y subunit C-2-like [Aristolochia californica]|uniref:nuclear transcription factor Y subunit C-2-like n=1 Tax=Aristolochia californica TaxID=171875 RepID=UPI0035DAE64C
MRQAGMFSGIHSGGVSGRTGPHLLPLARIKKIMKRSGKDVKMISGEAPIIFSKTCVLFIEELTLRSWSVTLKGKRRMLHKDDVSEAVEMTDIFDFLVDTVTNSGCREDGGGAKEGLIMER